MGSAVRAFLGVVVHTAAARNNGVAATLVAAGPYGSANGGVGPVSTAVIAFHEAARHVATLIAAERRIPEAVMALLVGIAVVGEALAKEVALLVDNAFGPTLAGAAKAQVRGCAVVGARVVVGPRRLVVTPRRLAAVALRKTRVENARSRARMGGCTKMDVGRSGGCITANRTELVSIRARRTVALMVAQEAIAKIARRPSPTHGP